MKARWREAASLMLWATITRGDYRAAPVLRTQPGLFSRLRIHYRALDSVIDFALGEDHRVDTQPGNHLRTLLAAFAPYRNELEAAVDATVLSE